MKHRHLRADPESLHQGPLVPKLYRRRRHRTGGSEKPKLLAVPNAQLALGGRMTILPLRGCFGSPCAQKHAADRRWINLLSSVMAENDNQSTDPIRRDSRPLCDQHPKLKQRGGHGHPVPRPPPRPASAPAGSARRRSDRQPSLRLARRPAAARGALRRAAKMVPLSRQFGSMRRAARARESRNRSPSVLSMALIASLFDDRLQDSGQIWRLGNQQSPDSADRTSGLNRERRLIDDAATGRS